MLKYWKAILLNTNSDFACWPNLSGIYSHLQADFHAMLTWEILVVIIQAPKVVDICGVRTSFSTSTNFTIIALPLWTCFCSKMPTVTNLIIGYETVPDSKVHEAYMGPTWGRQDPGGPHVDPMNLAIRGSICERVQSALLFFCFSILFFVIFPSTIYLL